MSASVAPMEDLKETAFVCPEENLAIISSNEPWSYASNNEPEPELKDLFQCARNGYYEEALKLLNVKKICDELNNGDDEGLTPLHYAARYNHFDIVKALVESGADVDCEDDEGVTPLQYACRIKRKRKKSKKSKANLYDEDTDNAPFSPKALIGGKTVDASANAIHFLIEHGADPNHKDDYGLTALHHAALRGDEVASEQLMHYDTDVNAKDTQKMTPLHTAACQCEYDVARQLIKAGADVRSRDDEQSTPLHEAATVGDTKTARLIFESLQPCDTENQEQLTELLADKDEDGNTPLMLAVESGRYKFVSQCMSKGAALNTTNNWKMTSLHLAAIKGDVRIVKLLIESGASISVLNHELQTPLHKASLFNNTDCIETLLDHGSNIEAKDKDNFTPLLLAACYGHKDAVERLLKRGADVTAEDKNDRTTVYLAAEENKLEVLEVLMKNEDGKSLINNRDEHSNGPLHISSSLGYIRIVKCLLNHGADLYCKNDMEQTPIHMAAACGCTNVVREIVRREKNTMSDGDEDSNTALHLAAMGGHLKLVETLLNLGAEPEVRNSALRTPIGCAAAAGYLKTVKLLAASDALIDTVDKQKMTPLLAAAQNGHAEVVDFLIEKRADVAKLDINGLNCLDLAIKHDHQDVALEIIKSKAWKPSLKNSNMDKGSVDTPMRKLIRKMPDVAVEVFNRCIETKKPDEGSQHDLNVKYEVKYNFEFIDDTYNIRDWMDREKVGLKKKRVKVPKPGFLPDGKQTESDANQHLVWAKKMFKHDGRLLVPYTTDSAEFKKNHPIMIMVESSREELLDHPLITALRRNKWEDFGRVFYYVSLGTYFIFLAFLTGYVIVTPPPFAVDVSDPSLIGNDDCEKYEYSGAKQHTFARVGKFFILVLAFFNLIKEAFQAFHGKYYYLTWENLLECATFVCTALLCLDFETCQAVSGYRTYWQWNFGSMAIVLAWIALVLYIQKFPSLGIYVVMFKYILYTFFKFSLVFLLFIIAFGLGFFCLLQNQTPYATAWHSIIRTTVMMIGEFDYNDIFHGEDEVHFWITYILFCIFIVIMTIIIMNLLVGLAVDDIKGVQEQAALTRIAMKVHLVLDVERISLRFTSRYYKDSKTRYFSTAEDAAAAIKPDEQFENQIQQSQQKVLKKVDKLKNGLKGLKSEMAKLEDMLEAIMKAQDIKLKTEEA